MLCNSYNPENTKVFDHIFIYPKSHKITTLFSSSSFEMFAVRLCSDEDLQISTRAISSI